MAGLSGSWLKSVMEGAAEEAFGEAEVIPDYRRTLLAKVSVRHLGELYP
jgi:hypothetical protein